MITQFTEVLHRLGIKTADNRKHRTNLPSRPQATNGSGPVARRDPAAQAGRRPQTAESPIETRCPTRGSIKPSFQSASADAQFPCAPSALMENQPDGWFSPLLPFVQCLRSSCRRLSNAHGIRSRGTDSPIPVPTAPPLPCQTALWARYKGKDRPEGRSFHERTLCAEYCATCGSRFYFCFG